MGYGMCRERRVATPNLNRLASTGIRFDNFFCASPVCSPARASILTGQIPSQHSVQDFLREGNHPNLPNDGREIQYLAGKKAYVTVLAANGYDCGLSGNIPIEIGNLDALIKLRLQDNKLIGIIPSTICNLHNIHSGSYWFNLDNNYFCPTYPDCIANLIDNQRITNCK